MAYRVFVFCGKLRECLVLILRHKNRVIAKTAVAVTRFRYATFHLAFKHVLLAVDYQGNHRSESRIAVALAVEISQQLVDVRLGVLVLARVTCGGQDIFLAAANPVFLLAVDKPEQEKDED